MTTSCEIQKGLRMAGTPEYVDHTTLAKEGAHEIRQLITDGVFAKPKQSIGLYLYPTKPASYNRCRELFYIVAKELFLSGSTVYCIPLSRLHDAITCDDITREATMVAQSRFVFVTDFYEEGAEMPLTAAESSKVRMWVKDKYEKGGAVCFLADKSPDLSTAWWPHAFVGFITGNTIIRGE